MERDEAVEQSKRGHIGPPKTSSNDRKFAGSFSHAMVIVLNALVALYSSFWLLLMAGMLILAWDSDSPDDLAFVTILCGLLPVRFVALIALIASIVGLAKMKPWGPTLGNRLGRLLLG